MDEKDFQVISAILDRINPDEGETLAALKILEIKLKKYNVTFKSLILQSLKNLHMTSNDSSKTNNFDDNINNIVNNENISDEMKDFLASIQKAKARGKTFRRPAENLIKREHYGSISINAFLTLEDIKEDSFNKRTYYFTIDIPENHDRPGIIRRNYYGPFMTNKESVFKEYFKCRGKISRITFLGKNILNVNEVEDNNLHY